jgi:hypothetical protein
LGRIPVIEVGEAAFTGVDPGDRGTWHVDCQQQREKQQTADTQEWTTVLEHGA